MIFKSRQLRDFFILNLQLQDNNIYLIEKNTNLKDEKEIDNHNNFSTVHWS
jgi:hypothetical protein